MASGSSITGNKATNNGGGVYFGGDTDTSTITFKISGSVDISGNKKGDAANNVYLPADKYITIAGELTGSNKIGVTTAKTPDTSKYVKIASSDNQSYADPEKFQYENDGAISVSTVSMATQLTSLHVYISGEQIGKTTIPTIGVNVPSATVKKILLRTPMIRKRRSIKHPTQPAHPERFTISPASAAQKAQRHLKAVTQTLTTTRAAPKYATVWRQPPAQRAIRATPTARAAIPSSQTAKPSRKKTAVPAEAATPAAIVEAAPAAPAAAKTSPTWAA